MRTINEHLTACFAVAMAACLWLIHVDVGAQPRYSINQINPDPVKGSAKGIALNDAGQVVGEYCPLPAGGCQPFVFREGRLDLIDLEIPDAIYARASLITNEGLVAGTYQTEGRSGPMSAGSFLYRDGRLNPFQPPWPLNRFQILGLNDQGDAFGIAVTGQREAFIYLGGELRMIKPDHFAFATARALNQAGQIAGGKHEVMPRTGGTVEFLQPYILSKDATLRLEAKDLESTTVDSVTAVNNHGHVVGQASVRARGRFGGFQAFVAKESRIEVLDVNRHESIATDINDQGTVVGFRHDHTPLLPFQGASIRRGAFLWTNGKTYSLDKIAGMTIDRDASLRINQRGQILVNVHRQAYLLTPVIR